MQAPPPPPPPGRPQEVQAEGGDAIEQLSRVPANMRCGGCGSKAREYDEAHLRIVYIMERPSCDWWWPRLPSHPFFLTTSTTTIPPPKKKTTFSYQ